MAYLNTPLVRITLVLVIGLVVVGVMWTTLPLWHEQTINLDRIEKWKIEVTDQVSAFEKEIGCPVQIYGFTAMNGVVGVNIKDIPPDQSDAIIKRTYEFIRTLNPPRPAYYHCWLETGQTISFNDDLSTTPTMRTQRR